jgi:hypothetical protein
MSNNYEIIKKIKEATISIKKYRCIYVYLSFFIYMYIK